MRQIPTFILVLLLVSCGQAERSPLSYRDTILKNYLEVVDSSGKFDTTDINFKALKAYYTNDTSSLQELDSFLKDQKTQRRNWDLWKSDIPLPALNKLNVEAAFRFVFSLYGGPMYESITVTMNDTTYKLHYLRYYHDKDNATFKNQKEFEKPIQEKEWQELTSKLFDADFWGLKSENNVRGDDGNDLTVIGYQRFDNNERYHFVHRWTRSTLNDPFYYIYYNLLNKHERLFGTE